MNKEKIAQENRGSKKGEKAKVRNKKKNELIKKIWQENKGSKWGEKAKVQK